MADTPGSAPEPDGREYPTDDDGNVRGVVLATPVACPVEFSGVAVPFGRGAENKPAAG